jgi:hypothetical protein
MNKPGLVQARKIGPAEMPAVLHFIQSQEDTIFNREAIEDYLRASDTVQRNVAGVFEGEKLLGIAGLYYFSDLPWASIVFLMSDKTCGLALRMAGILNLVDFCFSQIEDRGCVRIFMANEMQTREKHINSRLIPLAKKLERLQNYEFISEGFLPVGQNPEFDYQWQLIGRRLPAIDIGFVSATRRT